MEIPAIELVICQLQLLLGRNTEKVLEEMTFEFCASLSQNNRSLRFSDVFLCT